MRFLKVSLLQIIFTLAGLLFWFLFVSDLGGQYTGEPLWGEPAMLKLVAAFGTFSLTLLPTAVIYTGRMEHRKKVRWMWLLPVLYFAIGAGLYLLFAAKVH